RESSRRAGPIPPAGRRRCRLGCRMPGGDRACEPPAVMSNILFAHGHLLRFDRKQLAIGKPYPPLATITAAAYLRSRGHGVALYDPTLDEDTRGFAAALAGARPDILILYD